MFYAYHRHTHITDYIDITHQPENVKVAIDGLARLSVVATGPGSDHFVYKWIKFGSNSLPSSASGGNTPHLHFTSVTQSDGGLYYCVVANQWGNRVTSRFSKVDVLCKLSLATTGLNTKYMHTVGLEQTSTFQRI